jgi:hypothetical protein
MRYGVETIATQKWWTQMRRRRGRRRRSRRRRRRRGVSWGWRGCWVGGVGRVGRGG